MDNILPRGDGLDDVDDQAAGNCVVAIVYMCIVRGSCC